MRTIALMLLAAGSVAVAQTQIPIPSFGGTFSATLTRGFWFQAPVGFLITGLRVPDESLQGVQNVEVFRMTAAPPAYPATASGTQVFLSVGQPSSQIISCALAFAPGEFVGILGACGTTTMANSYGVSPFASNILGTPVTLTRFLTQTNLGTSGGNQPYSTEAGGSVGRVEVYVTPLTGYANASPYGTGCYDGIASFYETFPSGTFDLGPSSGTNSIAMVPNGTGGYTVFPGSNAFFTPVSANLGLTDDSVSAAQALPFPLLTPVGSTTSLYVSSNGFVWTSANTNSGCCAGDPLLLLSQGERFASMWMDLNPSAGGSVHFDVDLPNGVAYVTWLNVPEFSNSGSNTMQIAFGSTGMVEYRWQACMNLTHQALVGWSHGNAARDPGSRDLSAVGAFTTAADGFGLALAAVNRPVMGTQLTLDTLRIPANTALGALVFGDQQINPGIDLGAIGAAGCSQYLNPGATLVFVPSVPTTSTVLTIPNRAPLVGLHFYTQSATFSPGYNPLGILTSNGVDLLFDLL